MAHINHDNSTLQVHDREIDQVLDLRNIETRYFKVIFQFFLVGRSKAKCQVPSQARMSEWPSINSLIHFSYIIFEKKIVETS